MALNAPAFVSLGRGVGLQCSRRREVAAASHAVVLAVARHVLVEVHPAADAPLHVLQCPCGHALNASTTTCSPRILSLPGVRDVAHLPVVPIGPFLPSCTLAVWRTSSQTWSMWRVRNCSRTLALCVFLLLCEPVPRRPGPVDPFAFLGIEESRPAVLSMPCQH